jgi:hypothetical protein
VSSSAEGVLGSVFSAMFGHGVHDVSGRQHRATAQQKTWLPPLESWKLTTHLYRPGAHPSNLRSMSSTIARTAIPITHYRILTKEQPAATARCVAERGRRWRRSRDHFVAEDAVRFETLRS